MKSVNMLGIEGKIEYLIDELRRYHEDYDRHLWYQDHRPWERTWSDGHEYYIQCKCGVSKKATKEEFDKAEKVDHYDGY